MKRDKDNTQSVVATLFPKTKKRLLDLFFSYPDDHFYLKDIFGKIGGGRSTVQNTLASLTENGILKMERKGRYTYYRANQGCPLFSDLVSIYNKCLASKFKDALRKLKGIEVAFIYGSTAEGKANKKSDIDLMVLGNVEFGEVSQRLHNIRLELRRDINPTVFDPDEFRDMVKRKNHFIKTVMQGDKFFILGDDDELKRLAE